jgi:hypothetical protein
VDGFIDIGFTAAVGAKDDIQRPEFQLNIPDRSEIFYPDMVNHRFPKLIKAFCATVSEAKGKQNRRGPDDSLPPGSGLAEEFFHAAGQRDSFEFVRILMALVENAEK